MRIEIYFEIFYKFRDPNIILNLTSTHTDTISKIYNTCFSFRTHQYELKRCMTRLQIKNSNCSTMSATNCECECNYNIVRASSPESISHSTIDKEYTSAAWVKSPPCSTSGASQLLSNSSTSMAATAANESLDPN